ncbi:MAG TPA: hypothetical protein VGN17_27010 [Bryobacteraceae bacterium]|jgi:hypothetical protein
MGANSTQAIALTIFLIAFVLIAGAFAGGGIMLAVGGVALVVIASFFFMKCKPWENQE